ncbi:conserved protein of unknown function [Methylorubrum extorquens]|uniref:Uncharacterized protein n=1 Tax=Methylorubrum extorquens TaxID=408 RepID=A0A2N9AXC8_METEX|nr:conserved protein of unknown function [Methylorubrum extorquens]
MIHLSNSSGHTRRPNPSPKTRQPSGCPADPAHSSAMKSAARVQPGAGSPRRLEPANRSVNRPRQAPERPDQPTPRNQKDSDRPIQSPGSAPLTNNPEDHQNPAPPTGGPRRPVGERGYKGAYARRQSEKRGKREKGRHKAAERTRGARRTLTALLWTRWMRASVFGWPRATLLLAVTRSASCPALRYPPPASSRRARRCPGRDALCVRASIPLCHRHCRHMPPRFLAILWNALIPAAKSQSLALTEAGLVAKGQITGREPASAWRPAGAAHPTAASTASTVTPSP